MKNILWFFKKKFVFDRSKNVAKYISILLIFLKIFFQDYFLYSKSLYLSRKYTIQNVAVVDIQPIMCILYNYKFLLYINYILKVLILLEKILKNNGATSQNWTADLQLRSSFFFPIFHILSHFPKKYFHLHFNIILKDFIIIFSLLSILFYIFYTLNFFLFLNVFYFIKK